MINAQVYPCARCTALFKPALETMGQFAVEVIEDRGALADPSAYDERAFGYPDFQDLCAKALRDVCGSDLKSTLRIRLLGYGPAFGMSKHYAEQVAATQGFKLTGYAIGAGRCGRCRRQDLWSALTSAAGWLFLGLARLSRIVDLLF